ncbi:hypothetical protein [Pantoea phytobeneficialis]|uniref:SIR2-like domain-containing protein n=1 Tax=Pantoea phytobeneficialis TaxID=2052056 RepID=A0AAP9H4L3_9GAMM|nr:hypothetical protein [Pantoea phytobeneficialis]MDO6406248.1 hypothetical protein [Pantoea phytobeneficialis]QGR06256.1 hypothetical protein CTZ24_07495 [Pantoea phytobeneficialis]
MGYMVLLGAGASFGSGDVTPYPPPLGNRLFEKLDGKGGVASKLPQDLKDKFINNFEEGMADYYVRYNQNIMSFQRELAGYLVSFTPGDNNHYKNLINSLNNKRVVYSSLNYDILFELSAFQLNHNITYHNKHEDGYIRLLKIHGSSNFWPDLGNTTFRNCEVYGGGIADIDTLAEPVSQEESKRRAIFENSVAPAIAMYAEGKAIKVCPRYIQKQQQMWNETLTSTSKIFIIGVRVHQADVHIWKMIADSKAEVHYFGRQSDENEFNAWKNEYNRKNTFFWKLDFADAVNTIKNLTRS